VDVLITLILLFVFMIVLIYLSGWFSGTETALTNISAEQLATMRKDGTKNVQYIIRLRKDMDRTLITILIGNNIVNILLSSVAAIVANELFAEMGVSVMVFIITLLIIVFGEITPKSAAINDTPKVALRVARKIFILKRVLCPLVGFFTIVSRGVLSVRGLKRVRELHVVSDDTIKHLASMGEEEGVLKPIERDIIHKVFKFGDARIGSIMTPMSEVLTMKGNPTLKTARKTLAAHGYTRVPMVDDSGNVVGILYSKDLLEHRTVKARSIMRRPFMVRATDDVTDVLKQMKKQRVHMAIVEDDTDATVGVVTLEDIIEELVGEIHDEYSQVKSAVDRKSM